ncbi:MULTISPECIES: twin-arginine translocase subunit TatC [Streptomycetaceae]|uniref:Sec-independent protein translocase protein TatC n=1 Tax=Streptantibioticus cattleyicolor (strain ATCC 35852 / DSM 46488 / JCM 4925 / NBRC 14057 / NRRL 8057) TaxID=1003195 RepID=F8K2N7_STREN|nr:MULTISPECIES: twin-arginine translocase subunit TatC [Streptomycetaceae]AEW97547.1 integral membrane protein [Streptantibioticus cattleyicolor NRRL 8057 = DSM 46488]MYS61981.1 twin-arginine translocase subunit TatC [Streptomyces sp. SID5468]CCB77872.1 putative sec-independent protein translocase protein TatC [Streptantibioticus cattleyicolor NRRL 8057 = DSM 46488]
MLKSARKPKDPEGRMPLGDHLRELRNRLLKALLAVGVITGVSFAYYEPITNFLTAPLRESVGCVVGMGFTPKPGQHCAQLNINGLLGPFSLMLKVGLMSGVVIASPIWLYQLWAFLAPGLHRNEKKYALSFVGAGFPLFIGGACFAYLLLPTTAHTLIGLTPDHVTNLVPLDGYLDLLTRMVLVFGFSFELPLLLVLLNFGGILTGRRMLGWWRWMVMGITVFAAIATPSSDPLTMLALAAPITALFFLAVGIALFNDRRRARRAGEELDPDEASELDLTPEALPEIESVGAPALPEQPSRMDDGPSATGARGDGFDDAT